jgi:hypothetical protein
MAETVMSVGDDPQLLSLRHAVLELAGYHVITESNAHAASQKIASAPCDVLLLCYSMDINVRQRLAREFREHCPDGRIIANYEPASGEASGGCGGFPLWCRRSRVAPRNTARADGRTESRRLGPLADNQTPVARPVTVAQYVAAQNINNFYACFTDRFILALLKSPGFANYFVAEAKLLGLQQPLLLP